LANKGSPFVLIVDDEAGIRRAIEGVLQDEGYTTRCVESGEAALQAIQNSRPDLVLLDIWMSGLDGMETLQRIKEYDSSLPVIMMSGHASIATAIHATRIGASDFIEKPIDLDSMLRSVRRTLGKARGLPEEPTKQDRSGGDVVSAEVDQPGTTGPEISPVVFNEQWLRGQPRVQRTLASSAVLYGQGLHSGKKSGLILEPLPPNSGIHFAGVAGGKAVPAHLSFVRSTGFDTTLKLGDIQVATIEHLMSALCAYGISNLLIKCNGEVPVMDGSAREFCALLGEIGIVEQEGEWYDIAIPGAVRFGTADEWIELTPGEGLTIDYTLVYPYPVGEHRLVFSLSSPESFSRDIAPARTFGFVKDISMLQKQGLALGGRFDNFVLIGDDGPINSELRFPDELVRHKILDAIGDLYLLGRRLQGRITAVMTGHSDNVGLLELVSSALVASKDMHKAGND
jgi:UDP-3-O-acyl N-acetylglucosamine deacetylase